MNDARSFWTQAAICTLLFCLLVPQTGKALTPAPVLEFSQPSLAFGLTACGSTACRDLELRNTGDASLTITRVSAVGAFSMATGVPLQIPAGQSRTVQICYAPIAGDAQDSAQIVFETAELPARQYPVRGLSGRPLLTSDSAVFTMPFLRIGYSRNFTPIVRNTGSVALQQMRVASTPREITVVSLPTQVQPGLPYQVRISVMTATLGPGQARFHIRYAPCGGAEDSTAVTVRWTATDAMVLKLSGPDSARPGAPVIFTIHDDEIHAPPPTTFRIDLSYDRALLMSEAGSRGLADDVLRAGTHAEGFTRVTAQEFYSGDTATLRIEMSGGTNAIGSAWGPIARVRLTPLVGHSRTAHAWISHFDYGTPYVSADLGLRQTISLDSICNFDLRLLNTRTRAASIQSVAPSPLEPHSLVRIQVSPAGVVTAVLRDLLGREVARVVHRYLEEGSHVLPVPAALTPHALYMLELHHPGGGESRLVVTGAGWSR